MDGQPNVARSLHWMDRRQLTVAVRLLVRLWPGGTGVSPVLIEARDTNAAIQSSSRLPDSRLRRWSLLRSHLIRVIRLIRGFLPRVLSAPGHHPPYAGWSACA